MVSYCMTFLTFEREPIRQGMLPYKDKWFFFGVDWMRLSDLPRASTIYETCEIYNPPFLSVTSGAVPQTKNTVDAAT